MTLPDLKDTARPESSIATTNTQIVDLWVHGKSKETQELYRRCATRLFEYVAKPLQWVTLADLQGFADSLEASGLSPETRRGYIIAVKSLFSFAFRLGLIPTNVAVILARPKVKNTLSQKILTEEQVRAMIALEPNYRNKLILKTLYCCGLRVSSLCSLTWNDLTPNGQSGQLTILGKGWKTYVVLLPESLYRELLSLRQGAGGDEPIFRSRKGTGGGHLKRTTVTQLVKDAGLRAGLSEKVSAHWLRHCHASHALDRGAPLSLVQQTLNHSSLESVQKYLHAKPNQSSGLYLNLSST
jgi:integrase/recombinase XerD